jgi:uncharacterized protein (DUF302 family)
MKDSESRPPAIVYLPARGTVQDAWSRLEAAVAARELLIFARIDYAADAARVGLNLRPMRLLVFGNPRAGTALLVAAPTAGLDLPLKILIWEEADGSAMVGYVSPAAIATRHGLPAELWARLQPVIALAAAAAGTT